MTRTIGLSLTGIVDFVATSLTGGVRRVANRNGLVLLLAFLVLGVVWQVSLYTAFLSLVPEAQAGAAAATLPTVAGPPAVLGVVAAVSLLALQYFNVVAIRTFVGGHADAIPSEYYTRSVAWVLLNTIVGSIAYGLIVALGTIALLAPGIIAYVAFVFVPIVIAVDDANFVAALKESWNLTRGNWMALFLLLTIVISVTTIVAGILSGLLNVALASAGYAALGTLLAGLLFLPVSLLTLGILAEAFTQLGERRERATGI